VRHTPGELADGLELLRVQALFLGPPPGGDIEKGPHRARARPASSNSGAA